MLRRVVLACWATIILVANLNAQGSPVRVYELRIFTASPGKLEALSTRFREHTCKYFEKHGITSIGYWVPVENVENKLYCIVGYPSKESREASLKAFRDDPDWKAAFKASEKDGTLTAKMESLMLRPADFSPLIKVESKGDRVFELRTYTASVGNLENLHARFRDHTCKLFTKHGMTNIAFWTPVKDQKGTEDMLVYLLAHKSVEAAKQSFAAFRDDPAWIKAKEASEKKAGGPLTVKDGIKSVFLKPTDYSPMK